LEASTRRFALPLAAVATVALVAAGCGGGGGGGGGGNNTTTSSSSSVKAALVTDIGGLNDKGFNHLAYLGITRAHSQLGVAQRVYITNTSQQRGSNLQAAAKAGYGIVVATGFNFISDLPNTAKAFPKTKFVGVDVSAAALKPSAPNYHGLVFKEQEAGYLVGYIAGLMIQRHPYKGKQVVSAVGANPVPAIVHYLAGFQAGAKKANPGVTVLLNYANDPTFNDQTKCKVTTQNQISRGSGIVFEAAGGCGLGGLDAAKQAGIWGIGVDADQGYLGTFMLTSALKKVDVAVFDAIKEFKDNPASLKGNSDSVFDVQNGGVGYAPLSSKVSQADNTYITGKVKAIAQQIASGKIQVPTSF
jgi:basic membrane protein A and related proteins